MPTPLNNAGVFLVQTICDLFLFIVMLRLLMQMVRVNFYNPMCQFVVKATNPILLPLQRVIPRFANVDLATVLVLLLTNLFKFSALILLNNIDFPPFLHVLTWAISDITLLAFNIFFYSIIIRMLLSWINPTRHNPTAEILHSITEPLLSPIRKKIPVIAGLDMSPFIVLILLQLVKILFISPLLSI